MVFSICECLDRLSQVVYYRCYDLLTVLGTGLSRIFAHLRK